MKAIRGSWADSSNGPTAGEKADMLGKEGHACQGQALNWIWSAMGNHRRVLSQRVAHSNFRFRKFPLTAGIGGFVQSLQLLSRRKENSLYHGCGSVSERRGGAERHFGGGSDRTH